MLSRARFKHCVMFESERPHRASQKNLTPGSETLRDEWANEQALHRSLLWLASVRSRGASSLSPSCGHRARCRLYVTRREGTFKGLWLRPAYFSLSPSFFFFIYTGDPAQGITHARCTLYHCLPSVPIFWVPSSFTGLGVSRQPVIKMRPRKF